MTTIGDIRARASDERGSLLLAMLATIVVGGMVAVLFSAVTHSQTDTRRDRDYQQTVHGAETGLQEATTRIYDIELLEEPGDPVEITGSGTAASVDWTYIAKKTTGNRWEVRAEGESGGVTRALEVVVQRPALFDFALFGENKIKLTGNNYITSYSSDTGQLDTGDGHVGSNGNIHSAGSAEADEFILGGPSATCHNCTGGVTRVTEPLEYSLDPVYEGLDACYADGETLVAWRASDHEDEDGMAWIENGPNGRLCVTSLILDSEEVRVKNGPVKVYVTGKVEIAKDAKEQEVNCKKCLHPGPPETATPDASQLQIYSSGNMVKLGFKDAIAAALYAPKAICQGNNSTSKLELYGSYICREFIANGPVDIRYDDTLKSIHDGPFAAGTMREEPGSTSFGWVTP